VADGFVAVGLGCFEGGNGVFRSVAKFQQGQGRLAADAGVGIFQSADQRGDDLRNYWSDIAQRTDRTGPDLWPAVGLCFQPLLERFAGDSEVIRNSRPAAEQQDRKKKRTDRFCHSNPCTTSLPARVPIAQKAFRSGPSLVILAMNRTEPSANTSSTPPV